MSTYCLVLFFRVFVFILNKLRKVIHFIYLFVGCFTIDWILSGCQSITGHTHTYQFVDFAFGPVETEAPKMKVQRENMQPRKVLGVYLTFMFQICFSEINHSNT